MFAEGLGQEIGSLALVATSVHIGQLPQNQQGASSFKASRGVEIMGKSQVEGAAYVLFKGLVDQLLGLVRNRHRDGVIPRWIAGLL